MLTAVARFPESATRELSGLVQSRSHPGVFWGVNDSGNKPRVYPLRADGTLVTAPGSPEAPPGVHLSGAHNVDWEAVAVDASHNLIVADLGNNANDRQDLALYFLPEPSPDAPRAAVALKVPVRYPDQTAFPPPEQDRTFDAESLFTVGDDVFVLTKDRSDTFTKLYRLASRDPDRSNTLTYLDRFDTGGPVTAADASPDGLRLAVLTHHRVWMFERTDTRRPFFAARVLMREYQLAEGKSDCESICFETPTTLLIAGETQGRLYRFTTEDLREVSPGPPIPQGTPERDLRVMSFNLRYANTSDGPNNWSLRQPLVADVAIGGVEVAQPGRAASPSGRSRAVRGLGQHAAATPVINGFITTDQEVMP